MAAAGRLVAARQTPRRAGLGRGPAPARHASWLPATGMDDLQRVAAPALLQRQALDLQRLAGNQAVVQLVQARRPAVATPLTIQREFIDEGETGEATIEPAAGEVTQPDLGGQAEQAEPTPQSMNEFGEMDGSIDTGVAPHTFLNKGQVAKGKWHHCGGSGGKGNEGVGSADLVAPAYDSAPPKKAGGQATAKVRKGTGKVKVKRSYNGVVPGDNGPATWAGSGGGDVFIMWSAVERMAKHEAGHIKETKKFHDADIKPLETRLKATRKAATEADAISALQTHVDWNASVNSFATSDTSMNTPGGTFDTTDQAKADFYHDKGPKTIKKKAYGHLIEAP